MAALPLITPLQVIRIGAKYRQMARSVLVHLPKIMEEDLFGPTGQMVTDAIYRAGFGTKTFV